MNTFRCDGCKSVVDKPALLVQRTDGLGGGSIRFDPGKDYHFCRTCSVKLSAAVGALIAEAPRG